MAETAPAGATCPTCGLDVAGFTVRTSAEGDGIAWDRPVRWGRGPSGMEFADGGLTHVQGGRRCRTT